MPRAVVICVDDSMVCFGLAGKVCYDVYDELIPKQS